MADLTPYCSEAAMPTHMSDADMAYCEAKAHQAVVNFYGANNIPHLGIGAVSVNEPVLCRGPARALYTKQGAQLSTNLAGRAVLNRAKMATPRVVIAQDATGKTSRMIVSGK